MFYSKIKKEALQAHEKAVTKYNDTYSKVQLEGESLYITRKDALDLIRDIEGLVNSITNSPKEFEAELEKIRAERKRFKKTEEYAQKAHSDVIKSGAGVAVGITSGAAVASLAPTAAMWVATTFGTASTGTAISALHGAVATKAALAWLGGGALSAGGGGVAAGQALLALAGPVGWSIAGVATGASAFFLTHKNHKTADAAMEQAREITLAGAKLNEMAAVIHNLQEETTQLYGPLNTEFQALRYLNGADYQSLDEEIQIKLGSMVNKTLTLATLVNKKLGED